MAKIDPLLRALLDDQKTAPAMYNPGPYWIGKSQTAGRILEQQGIEEFRNSHANNPIAASYGDATMLDVRNAWQHGYKRIARRLLETAPLSRLFDGQVLLTKQMYHNGQIFKRGYIESCKASRVRELLAKYTLPDTTAYGCDDVSWFDGIAYSNHYLEVLQDIDHVSAYVDLRRPRTMVEIGPGFGTNAHLVLENFPNVRKYLIVDIVPNIYVATKYLERFYPGRVKTYVDTRNLESIRFADDDSLEIVIVPPWQIERLAIRIDCFWNASSFVEMPSDVVANYAKRVLAHSRETTSFVLISYDVHRAGITLDPNTLPGYFGPAVSFEASRHPRLCVPERENYYFTGRAVR